MNHRNPQDSSGIFKNPEGSLRNPEESPGSLRNPPECLRSLKNPKESSGMTSASFDDTSIWLQDIAPKGNRSQHA